MILCDYVLLYILYKVLYRVRVDVGHEQGQFGPSVTDNLVEDFLRVLLALVVTHDGNLYLLLVAEELVVRHFARQEGIGLQAYGLVQHEGPSPTTQGHRLYGPPQQFVVLQSFDVEHILHALQESQRVLRRRQVADEPRAGHDVALAHAHRVPLHHGHVHQSQLFSNAVVHTVLGIVQVGVGGIDGDVVLDGQSHAALHLCALSNLTQGAEQQGVVTDDEVTAEVYGLAYHLLGNVQTQ